MAVLAFTDAELVRGGVDLIGADLREVAAGIAVYRSSQLPGRLQDHAVLALGTQGQGGGGQGGPGFAGFHVGLVGKGALGGAFQYSGHIRHRLAEVLGVLQQPLQLLYYLRGVVGQVDGHGGALCISGRQGGRSGGAGLYWSRALCTYNW